MGCHVAMPSTNVGSGIHASTVVHHKNSEHSKRTYFFVRVATDIKAFGDERKQAVHKGRR